MGTIECSQPASKSSWDSQDFGDISMVLKMAHFRKSTGPRWVNNVTGGFLSPRVRNTGFDVFCGIGLTYFWTYSRVAGDLAHVTSL